MEVQHAICSRNLSDINQIPIPHQAPSDSITYNWSSKSCTRTALGLLCLTYIKTHINVQLRLQPIRKVGTHLLKSISILAIQWPNSRASTRPVLYIPILLRPGWESLQTLAYWYFINFADSVRTTPTIIVTWITGYCHNKIPLIFALVHHIALQIAWFV